MYVHGKRNSRLYNVWHSMKSRCLNKNDKSYKNYGGRGIKVCDEWKNDFMSFYNWAINNGYDDKALRGECTLDRININGNYEPSNCRWTTIKKQQYNKQNNHIIEYNGKKHTITEWSKILNIHYTTIIKRLSRGWSVEKTFKTIPAGSRNFKEKWGIEREKLLYKLEERG